MNERFKETIKRINESIQKNTVLKTKHIDKFLEMRIEGETFDSIAKKLKVSKQTLINWSKEKNIKDTIQAGKLMKYQSILKSYQLNREAKIEKLAILSKRINEELAKRDLSDIPTEKLLKMAILQESRLDKSIPKQLFRDKSALYDQDYLDAEATFYFNPED